MKRTYVYGASGHGKVVADILLACKDPTFVGFVDDRAELHGAELLGFPVFGNGDWLLEKTRQTRVAVALGVGDNYMRLHLAEKCLDWGAELATLVHPSASVSASAKLGVGTVVMARAAINPDARIGRGSIVNTGAVIEHDVEVGEFVHVAPNSTTAGACRLGDLSFLGIGASIIQGVCIGTNTTIGAGSVVVRDVGSNVVAFGVPARVIRTVERPCIQSRLVEFR